MNILVMDMSPGRREKKQHLQSILAGLAEQSDTRLLLACQRGSELEDYAQKNSLEAISAKPGKPHELLLRLRLRWRLRKHNEPWLIQCYDEKSFALALRLANKNDHLNVIYSALLPEPINNKRILENIHLVSAVIAGTKEIASIMASCGFLPSSLFVVPGCIDAAHYPAHRGRDDGRVVFACSDSLDSASGYEQLLQALACLHTYENMPPWELRITSGGTRFEALLEQARELHVESRLAIFGDFNSSEILRDCDIMIAPADSGEGSSLTVKEAWAAGLPVICSDIPPHRELVRDGLNGVFFQNKTPADLAEKMRQMALNIPQRASLAQAGNESLKNYSCEGMLRKHISLYNKILGQEQRLDLLKL